MFEQEIEMEKKQGSAIPILLMVGLIVALVGVAGYYLAESRKVLTPTDAASVVTNVLAAQGPVTVTFHTGMVKDGYSETPKDARYKLLQKIGIINIGKAKGEKIPVEVTPKGSALLKQISGVQQTKNEDGNIEYVVPLAGRKLVAVSRVTMNGPERATVQFSWRWDPSAIGESFDAAGPVVAGFNTWDRVSLIDKYGARFYHEAPTKVAIALVKGDSGWGPSNE
jgi:hypothetical protein